MRLQGEKQVDFFPDSMKQAVRYMQTNEDRPSVHDSVNKMVSIQKVGCFHQHIYNFYFDEVEVEHPNDSLDDFSVTYWPTLGIPGFFCDWNINTIAAGEALIPGLLMQTSSQGTLGFACGYYVVYEWSGTNGGVSFRVLSDDSLPSFIANLFVVSLVALSSYLL